MRQKTRILIYILIAIAVVIMGTLAMLNARQADKPASAQEHIDLGRIYLTELSYEKAVLEFTEAIEIDSLNPDAYMGLAEAYAGIGDTEKAIEVLEEGYDKTGDERLKNMLNELIPTEPEETTVTTTTTTITEITEPTIKMITVPNLEGLTREEAISLCEDAGLLYEIETAENDNVEKDYIISQSVIAGENVSANQSIIIIISEGTLEITTITTDTTTTAVTTIADATTMATTTTTAEITIVTTASETTKTQDEDFITIKGKQYSTSLTELILNNKNLTNEDIKPLEKMVNLTYLNLADNQISDISPLSTLTNLEVLILNFNNISDVSVLSNLTNLTDLQLGSNQISDINPLSGLTNLTKLALANNSISDISPLSSLVNLTYLNLNANQISDISALKGLTNLTKLELYRTPISNSDKNELRQVLSGCSIG